MELPIIQPGDEVTRVSDHVSVYTHSTPYSVLRAARKPAFSEETQGEQVRRHRRSMPTGPTEERIRAIVIEMVKSGLG